MIDERPGPSVGDAAELLETLGIDPRWFSGLKLVSEYYAGPLALSQFEVTGPCARIEVLKLALARATGSTTLPVRLFPAAPGVEAGPLPSGTCRTTASAGNKICQN